jgi:DNA-binding Xre family transcriptional regulator
MRQINRIKVVLVEQNKTGKWLAETLGKDVATISRWCSNVKQPTLETLAKVSDLLEVDIRDLLVSTKKKK